MLDLNWVQDKPHQVKLRSNYHPVPRNCFLAFDLLSPPTSKVDPNICLLLLYKNRLKKYSSSQPSATRWASGGAGGAWGFLSKQARTPKPILTPPRLRSFWGRRRHAPHLAGCSFLVLFSPIGPRATPGPARVVTWAWPTHRFRVLVLANDFSESAASDRTPRFPSAVYVRRLLTWTFFLPIYGGDFNQEYALYTK